MKQSITPQIALVSQSTAGRRLFALGIISIIAVATRTRTRTLTRSRSRSNRLHFAARMPRRRRLWCPGPWRSRTHDSEKPLQATGAARRRGCAKGLTMLDASLVSIAIARPKQLACNLSLRNRIQVPAPPCALLAPHVSCELWVAATPRRSPSRSRAAYKCLIYASKCLNRSQKDFAMAVAAAWPVLLLPLLLLCFSMRRTPLWPLWRHFELTRNHRHSQLIPSMHSDDADTDDDDEHIIIISTTDTSDLGAVPLFALSYKSIHRKPKPRCALCPRRVRISWMRSTIYAPSL